ncbi:diacylglycerol kinase [Thalassotalea sp. G2M2-11]|uniref:diacylglycerol kinase n=1 Tax=Thalassotalea sp. G2M2-11 TaxID=2787627 RepID=UPI001F4964B3|nr:diacylglycerol kinase [Thalassotalea sp. G2M2-11]
MSINQQQTHLGRITPAIRHSLAGLVAAYKNEIAFRQEVFLTIILLPTAFFIANDFVEFCLLASGIFAVLITELLNSGIEAAIDRISFDYHELSGRAKDLGSAAVFVAICYFLLVWGYKTYTLL